MGKKLFVVSDVHGHYTELIKALHLAGFDGENGDHIFLSCGDLFDRGQENPLVYDFVKGLQHKILIRGNHEDMLCRILKRGSLAEHEIKNKTNITVEQLLGDGAADANGCFDTTAHSQKIREILAFVDSMINYYETESYVFTHGWLPIDIVGRRAYIREHWREASEAEWEEARWLEWQQLYAVGAVLAGKTIVCGHRPARLAGAFDPLREPDCSEPFYGDGMIAIDAGTVQSGRVNVLVIEDHMLSV
ncbi:MAG: metallophosphoesterase [Clostridia bacterium]|nr:metallophosphoesterase [Clostridia bacterium]